MKGYLLDTCICVFLLRKQHNIADKLNKISPRNCYISEVTVAELKYGAYHSANPKKNLDLVEQLIECVNVVPFAQCIDVYAQEKSRLRKMGLPIEDFDLLIGATAVALQLVLVTDNEKHFRNIDSLSVQNWVERQ